MLAFPLAQILSRTELNSTEFFLLPPPPPLPVPLFSSGEQWNCFKDSGGKISQSQGGAHNYGLFWGYRYCLELNSTEFLLLPPPAPPHLLNSSFSSSSSASFSSFSSSPFPPLFAFASSSPVLCLLHSVIVWFLAYLKDKSGKILSTETDSRFL